MVVKLGGIYDIIVDGSVIQKVRVISMRNGLATRIRINENLSGSRTEMDLNGKVFTFMEYKPLPL